MTRRLAPAALALCLLALAPATAAEPASPESQIEAAVRKIYAVYRGDQAAAHTENLGIYSSRTRTLIQQWLRRLPTDEVTDMADFDWFCQCQDWDAERFAVTAVTVSKGEADSYDAAITYDIGWGEKRALHLAMVREDGAWRVDDIRFQDDLPPLRTALAGELEANTPKP